MLQCWSYEPRERPTFAKILEEIKELLVFHEELNEILTYGQYPNINSTSKDSLKGNLAHSSQATTVAMASTKDSGLISPSYLQLVQHRTALTNGSLSAQESLASNGRSSYDVPPPQIRPMCKTNGSLPAAPTSGSPLPYDVPTAALNNVLLPVRTSGNVDDDSNSSCSINSVNLASPKGTAAAATAEDTKDGSLPFIDDSASEVSSSLSQNLKQSTVKSPFSNYESPTSDVDGRRPPKCDCARDKSGRVPYQNIRVHHVCCDDKRSQYLETKV